MDDFKAIKVRLENYEILKTLGTGSFGRVKLVRHKKTNEYFALKILKKSEILRMKQTDHILSENAIMSRINHPFLTRMMGFAQNDKYLYFLMEFIQGGELYTLLRTRGKFLLPEVIDLKPENVLLSYDGYLKLCDFGFAKFVTGRTYTLCGTPEYIAPEILLNTGHGKPADWWTLGVFIYEMIAGIDPFNSEDPMKTYENIVRCKVAFPAEFDKKAKHLVKNLLVFDLTKRYGNLKDGINDIMYHALYEEMNWESLFEKKIKPPYIPEIIGPNDTSNFLNFAEEDIDNAKSLSFKEDPFINW